MTVDESHPHLRPDGTTFPPVTPDPPPPPGYEPPQVADVLPEDQPAATDENAGETGRPMEEPHAEEPPD
jgi:hypothetical protein